MCAPSSCRHRGSVIAQKQAEKAGPKKANGGCMTIVRWSHKKSGRDKSRETAKSTQLAHKQPAAQTTNRTTHDNRNNANPKLLPCVFNETIENRRQRLVHNNQQSGVKSLQHEQQATTNKNKQSVHLPSRPPFWWSAAAISITASFLTNSQKSEQTEYSAFCASHVGWRWVCVYYSSINIYSLIWP